MRIALLLVVLANRADAETCKPGSAPILEIHQGAKPAAKLATTRLYASGAWTSEVRDRGGKVRTESGCVAITAIDGLRDALRDAPWNTTKRSIACRADQPRFTTYRTDRVLYTERTCNTDVLDKASQRVLDLVEGLHLLVDLDASKVPCEPTSFHHNCR